MATFRSVRVSKFRHVYGQSTRREQCYEGIRITASAHDSQFCAVNPKFIAVVLEVSGGGAFQVLPLKWVGKVDYHMGRVSGHNGPINDIKWNPFNDNIIASASDDSTVRLWHIPDEGIKSAVSSSLCQLCGHSRRVGYIEWHPTAENVLASAGFDYRVVIWNVSSGECLTEIECHEDVIYSIAFNYNGSLLATTCKDKFLRLIDPRTGQVLQETVCHEGGKASKVVFLGEKKKILTTGFSRTSHRQMAMWDQENFNQPLFVQEIDASAGVLFPFFDDELSIIYLAGKGDGNIRYYEVLDAKPWIQYLSEFQSRYPQRGLGVMPKRAINVGICEIYRFYKMHTTQPLVEPLSFIVPRRSDAFQADLYPPTAGSTPALSADEWMCGIDKDPIRVSLRSGFVPATSKPVQLKSAGREQRPLLITSDRNNERKFQFLSQITKPDYREVTQREDYPDLLKQEQLLSKLHDRITQKLAGTTGGGGESAVEKTGGGGGGAVTEVSLDEEIAQIEKGDFPPAEHQQQRQQSSSARRETTTTEEEEEQEGEGSKESPKSAPPRLTSLPPRIPRSPITLAPPSSTVAPYVAGHSPSKMRRISQSPGPSSSSPLHELQVDSDVVSSASDGLMSDGQRRVSSTSRLLDAHHGSVEGALSIASSGSAADAVSLPPRTAFQSQAPLTKTVSVPTDHSHVHSHVPKFVKPQPVQMPKTVSQNDNKKTTRPGVIAPGPIIPREQTAHIKPFRIAQSQPTTPRENGSTSGINSISDKKDSEIQVLYTQQCRRVRELMDEMDVKDKKIVQLEQEMATLGTKVEQLQADFHQRQDEVDSLRYEISWKDGRITYLERELARFNST